MPPENKVKIEVRYVPASRVLENYAKASLGHPDGFLSPEELELVDVCTLLTKHRAANHPSNLHTIYCRYQSVKKTEDERTTQLEIRSMTMGDALVIDGRAYYVTDVGFSVKDSEGNLVPISEENHAAYLSEAGVAA